MGPWSGFRPDLRFILEYSPAHYAPHLLILSLADTCVRRAVPTWPSYAVGPQLRGVLAVGSVVEAEPYGKVVCRQSREVRDLADFSLRLKRAVTNRANPARTPSHFASLSHGITATYAEELPRLRSSEVPTSWQAPCDSMVHPRTIGPSSARQGRLRPEDCNTFSWRCRDGAA